MFNRKRKRRDAAINEARSLAVQRQVRVLPAFEAFKEKFPRDVRGTDVAEPLYPIYVINALREVIARLERTDNPEEG